MKWKVEGTRLEESRFDIFDRHEEIKKQAGYIFADFIYMLIKVFVEEYISSEK